MTVGEPAREQGEFVFLAGYDSVAQLLNRRTRVVRRRPAGDQDRLRVMVDHARHEANVGARVGTASAVADGRRKSLGCGGGGGGGGMAATNAAHSIQGMKRVMLWDTTTSAD